jgi:hypothetical protein
MRWIETIELRSTADGNPLKELDLQTLASKLPAEDKPYLMVLLQHATVKGDASVHLLFDADEMPSEGSELGLRLKENLRGSGLVSHKMWIEAKRCQVV